MSIMALIVGFMTSLAWISVEDRRGRVQRLEPDQRQRFAIGTLDLTEENEDLRLEVTKLRVENTKLQNALAKNSNASEELNKSLQEMKVFATLTDVEGPGVSVVLRDSKKPIEAAIDLGGQIVHDTDVLRVVNELKNAGAEAITVNKRRVGPRTNFRCVGTTILVDDSKIASPVIIRAIGETETLFGAMNLPGGVLDELRQVDPNMVEIQPVERMRLAAFSGSTTTKYITVPVDKE
ncbi:MAG: DUF881 domain-containing protein [Fimbriimonadaceae bacterium]|nr:DUF881 domain-containing protein [Fimbriimonadaceae bacterium]QYK55278.1 MAG: DUF881 domain-containing protein [Fimbriimonadaceae bacterium]